MSIFQSSTQPRQAATIFILVTIMLDMLSFGIIMPVLPKLVEDFMSGDTAQAASIYGLMGTAWAFMQFVCSPIQGALSDRFGRRPVVLFSNVGLGLDFILMAVAPNVTWLFVGRVIAGIAAASFSTAGAYIADVTPPEKRAPAFGMIGVAFGLGFVLGPTVGGLLGTSDPRLPFWSAAATSLLNACYGFFVLPESLPREKRMRFTWKRANPVGSFTLLQSHRELFSLASVVFLGHLAHTALTSVLVLYMGYRYEWDAKAVGFMLTGVGVGAMIVQGLLMRPLIARFGERTTLLAGLLSGAVAFAIYGTATNGWIYCAGIPIMAFWGLAGPSAQAFMSRRVSSSEQGQLQGAIAGLTGIASLIGPALFTQTFALFIGTQTSWHLPGAPFLLASLSLLVGMAIAWRATRASGCR
ncbi:MAG: TCR/Tet family MFS transporter [Nitrospira sp.]|nr:TCR/Tet family MFS transporter [Nitrospira sp.]MBH0183075.1 TCR/Tet family MFS transporter [Nitrospira sp.]MBH0185604.1 TCR/Tet family MFS transporter [Nitrospira sp.]